MLLWLWVWFLTPLFPYILLLTQTTLIDFRFFSHQISIPNTWQSKFNRPIINPKTTALLHSHCTNPFIYSNNSATQKPNFPAGPVSKSGKLEFPSHPQPIFSTNIIPLIELKTREIFPRPGAPFLLPFTTTHLWWETLSFRSLWESTVRGQPDCTARGHLAF